MPELATLRRSQPDADARRSAAIPPPPSTSMRAARAAQFTVAANGRMSSNMSVVDGAKVRIDAGRSERVATDRRRSRGGRLQRERPGQGPGGQAHRLAASPWQQHRLSGPADRPIAVDRRCSRRAVEGGRVACARRGDLAGPGDREGLVRHGRTGPAAHRPLRADLRRGADGDGAAARSVQRPPDRRQCRRAQRRSGARRPRPRATARRALQSRRRPRRRSRHATRRRKSSRQRHPLRSARRADGRRRRAQSRHRGHRRAGRATAASRSMPATSLPPTGIWQRRRCGRRGRRTPIRSTRQRKATCTG